MASMATTTLYNSSTSYRRSKDRITRLALADRLRQGPPRLHPKKPPRLPTAAEAAVAGSVMVTRITAGVWIYKLW